MTHVTCRLTAKNRDQLRNPTLGSRLWATFTFLNTENHCNNSGSVLSMVSRFAALSNDVMPVCHSALPMMANTTSPAKPEVQSNVYKSGILRQYIIIFKCCFFAVTSPESLARNLTNQLITASNWMPEVHKISQRHQRRTEPRPWVTFAGYSVGDIWTCAV